MRQQRLSLGGKGVIHEWVWRPWLQEQVVTGQKAFPPPKVCKLPDLQESYDSGKSIDRIALDTGSDTVPALLPRGG